ncbi:MAG TPA: dienelactone hydrolase family protein [Gammaproteobacteria bacterium]|nr:dienelactone hydrolase family protein [Gammaproteobacteria bacterium]
MNRGRSSVMALAAIVVAGALAACERSSPPTPGAAAVEQRRAAPTPRLEAPARAAVLEQQLAYGEAKSRNLVGFLAMPADAAEPLPAVIVIHEWWGLNNEIKTLTRRLAAEGYVALAVDLYGGATATTPADAEKLMTGVFTDPEAARANVRQAYEYLEKYAFAPRIGSIGWAFGGSWSLEAALLLPNQLDATVTYYGPLVTDAAKLQPIDAPILGLYGALDESIPARDVIAFRALLTNQLHKNAKIVIYPNARHAFASVGDGDYNAEAAAQAWSETLAFLNENLKLKAARP